MMIFFNILKGTITPHCTTRRDPRQKHRRCLFPSRTLLPLRRRSRLLGRYNPTNRLEFENIDMCIEPLLSILEGTVVFYNVV